MKTTARTALLGLLVSASLQSLTWAGDPNPTAANPFAPDSAPSPLTSQGAFAQAPKPVQPAAGHVSFDSPPAEPAPPAMPQSNGGGGGSSSPPGQVAYDSMANQPTWNNPFGVGDGPTTVPIPPGAERLQLGVNDDIYGADNPGSGNSGALIVKVSVD